MRALFLPAIALNFGVLTKHVETQLLGQFEVVDEGVISGRGVQTIRPETLQHCDNAVSASLKPSMHAICRTAIFSAHNADLRQFCGRDKFICLHFSCRIAGDSSSCQIFGWSHNPKCLQNDMTCDMKMIDPSTGLHTKRSSQSIYTPMPQQLKAFSLKPCHAMGSLEHEANPPWEESM